MNLKDELLRLNRDFEEDRNSTKTPDSPERLFLRVRNACTLQAQTGMRELRFQWVTHYSRNQKEWEEAKMTRDLVVDLLRMEGLLAEGLPSSFPIGTVWNEWTGENDALEANHFIKVSWG